MNLPSPIQSSETRHNSNLMKPVTVSVVSHNQLHLVANLLHDLNLHCGAVIEKIIVTINVTGENFLNQFPGRIPVVEIRNDQPSGFGANHNRAFEHCETDWFLVINPDVRMSSDVISRLFERKEKRTGLLAPQETDVHGVPRDHPRSLITPWGLLARRMLGREQGGAAPRLGWVKGMFMLMPAPAFRALKGFDERYVLYCEDFDLCARLILKGWTVDHHPDIALHHEWQRDSGRSLLHLGHHIASLLRMWSSDSFWRYRRLLRETAIEKSG